MQVIVQVLTFFDILIKDSSTSMLWNSQQLSHLQFIAALKVVIYLQRVKITEFDKEAFRIKAVGYVCFHESACHSKTKQ